VWGPLKCGAPVRPNVFEHSLTRPWLKGSIALEIRFRRFTLFQIWPKMSEKLMVLYIHWGAQDAVLSAPLCRVSAPQKLSKWLYNYCYCYYSGCIKGPRGKRNKTRGWKGERKIEGETNKKNWIGGMRKGSSPDFVTDVSLLCVCWGRVICFDFYRCTKRRVVAYWSSDAIMCSEHG